MGRRLCNTSRSRVEAACPIQLVSKVKRLCSLALTALEEFGLSRNLKQGKTTVVLCLQGRGLQEARKQAAHQEQAALCLVDLDVSVPVAPQHLHLGGLIDAKLNFRAEVRRRFGPLGSAFDQGKRLLFQNRTAPLSTRVPLIRVWSTSGSLQPRPVAAGQRRVEAAQWWLEAACGGGERGQVLQNAAAGCARPHKQLEPRYSCETKPFEPTECALVSTGPDILWAALRREGR